MIDLARFNLMRERHGSYGSWAVWAQQSGAPKSNMGDIQILDENVNPKLLEMLKPNIVMIGLNFSREFISEPFRNFHDSSPVANDFKIRYAFYNTEFWGAYMTDVIKGIVEPSSGQLQRYLRDNPEVVRDNINNLRLELQDLGQSSPLILAFGHVVYALLMKNLREEDYSLLIGLTHYSHQISKEKYKETVHRQILHARAGTA